MNFPKLEPYDIICSRGNSFISDAILRAGKRRTGHARVTHTAVAVGSVLLDDEILEALWRVVRHSAKRYHNQPVVIYRNKKLSLPEKRAIIYTAIQLERQIYPAHKILLYWLDSFLRTNFFTQKIGITDKQVCSGVASWAPFETFKEIAQEHFDKLFKQNEYLNVLREDLIFGKGWKSVSPDDIDDYCQSHPDEWEEIYNSL